MNKLKQFSILTMVLLSLSATSAYAALPTEVTAFVTQMTEDATALNSLVWGPISLVLGFLIVIKLVKRFGNKI